MSYIFGINISSLSFSNKLIFSSKYFKSLLFNENKKIEENKENIVEIKNKLNRKKREINNLKEQINKVEEDMKKKQTVENDV